MRRPVWTGEGEGTELLNDTKGSYPKARSGAFCMVPMLVLQTVFAEGETGSTPSVTAYATKEQLMDGTSWEKMAE